MTFKRLLAAALFALASIPAALGAQATYTTPTTGPMSFGTFVSTYLNPALAAVLSNNSGATAPAVSGQPGAYQWWVDTSTTPKTLKVYDGTSWLALATIDTSGHVLALNGSTIKLVGSSSGNTVVQPAAAASGTLTLPAATDTLIGKATTDTLTNKTFDTAGTGNSFSINGLAATANTGTGAVVRATSPTLVTPALGTPSSGTLTNATGLPISSGVSGLGTGVATFLGTPSSANLAAALTDETGTGAAVLATSPTLVTPVLGAATATSVNKLAITAPATGSTLTVADGKTLTANKSITLDGTDSTTMTFPSTSATIARTDAANTFTGHQTIEGVTSTGATGTGKFVFDTSPTLVTPALGTPSSVNLTNGTALPVSGITPSTSTALGVGSIELGHATDTTISRVSAGVAAIEGVNVVTTSSTDTLTNKSLTSPVATGTADVQQALKWSGDISPTQITSNQNDYAPTGFSTATTLRLSTDASRNITGLAGGAGGRVIVIHNVGAFNIVLTNQDAASTAANRFLFGGDITLAADTSVTIKYDATSSRWRAITSPGAGGGGGGVTSVAIAAGNGISVSGTCTITTSGTCTVTSTGVVLGTPTATTSGTTIDYTGVPSWAKEIKVHFNAVSLNDASALLVQLGDSGGIETTGYVSTTTIQGGTNTVLNSQVTTGFGIYLGNAAQSTIGTLVISLEDSTNNTWVASGALQRNDTFTVSSAGVKSTSATLDRVRITSTTPGTFDAGSVNVSYH